MASKTTHVIESDVYDINSNNLGDKFKEHFGAILQYVKQNNIRNAKITTRIRELNTKEIAIHTDIDEELKRFIDP